MLQHFAPGQAGRVTASKVKGLLDGFQRALHGKTLIGSNQGPTDSPHGNCDLPLEKLSRALFEAFGSQDASINWGARGLWRSPNLGTEGGGGASSSEAKTHCHRHPVGFGPFSLEGIVTDGLVVVHADSHGRFGQVSGMPGGIWATMLRDPDPR